MAEGKMNQVQKRNLRMAVWVFLGMFAFDILGRVLFTNPGDYTLEEWLFGHTVSQHEYPYGWLTQNGRYWILTAILVVAAALGKYHISLLTVLCSGLGFMFGVWLGDNPAGGGPIGPDHYGWNIWFLFVLTGVIMGRIMEKRYEKYGTYRHIWILRWVTALIVILVAILLNVVITIQGTAARLG